MPEDNELSTIFGTYGPVAAGSVRVSGGRIYLVAILTCVALTSFELFTFRKHGTTDKTA